MASEQAQAAKTAGGSAWTQGQYDRAVESFSTAISLGGDREFLKVVHSNRSAAYHKLNKFQEALIDANKCIELDSQWSKGYSRKGDALYALRRYTDSYNAYNSALRCSPGESSLKNKCDLAMRAIQIDSSSSPPSTVDSSPATRYIKLGIICLAIVYLIPLLPKFISSLAYKLSAGLYGGFYLMDLFKRCGYPKFTSEYGMLLAGDPSIMKIFLGFMLVFMPRQYIFSIAPIILSEGTFFMKEIFDFARANASSIEAQIVPLLSRVNPVFSQVSVATVFAPQHMHKASVQMMQLSATCEIYQGIFHIIELPFPSRNVIQLYLWWQYLKLRYMTDRSGQVKIAFGEVDRSLTQILNHQYCPSLIRQGYGMIKTFLAKQVQMPTAGSAGQGGGGSLLSKCTVM